MRSMPCAKRDQRFPGDFNLELLEAGRSSTQEGSGAGGGHPGDRSRSSRRSMPGRATGFGSRPIPWRLSMPMMPPILTVPGSISWRPWSGRSPWARADPTSRRSGWSFHPG